MLLHKQNLCKYNLYNFVRDKKCSQPVILNLYINLHSVCQSVCALQLFTAPRRPTLASEVPKESS